MSKKLTLIIGAFVLGLGLGLSQLAAPTFATDGDSAPVTSDIDPAAVPVVTSETGDGTIDEPTGPSSDNGEVVNPGDDQDESDKDSDKCDTDDETKCTDIDEDDADTEMWPMYVSLGALGGAIILVIIINVAFGRKRK